MWLRGEQECPDSSLWQSVDDTQHAVMLTHLCSMQLGGVQLLAITRTLYAALKQGQGVPGISTLNRMMDATMVNRVNMT